MSGYKYVQGTEQRARERHGAGWGVGEALVARIVEMAHSSIRYRHPFYLYQNQGNTSPRHRFTSRRDWV